MDPITLLVLSATALGAYAVGSEVARPDPGPMMVRQLYRWDNGWLATEMCSDESLKVSGDIFDLDLLGELGPAVSARTRRVIILTQSGGPASRAVIAIFERTGRYGYHLVEAYKAGMRRVNNPADYVRINELLARSLNADPAEEVVAAARQMSPVQRYHYLRQVLMANPVLSASLATSADFKEIVIETVSSPPVEDLTGRDVDPTRSPMPRPILLPGTGISPDFAEASMSPQAIIAQQRQLRDRALGATIGPQSAEEVREHAQVLRDRALAQ